MQIEHLDAATLRTHLDGLIALLCNAVDDGASIGFYPPPLTADEARAYWEGILSSIHNRTVLAALDDGRVAGCVQINRETRRNGTHRGEVQKLMVHTEYRRQGLGLALMQAVEGAARQQGLALLVLDVVEDAPAEHIYQRMGYQRAGSIPAYARSASGELEATVLYYRLLNDGES